MSTLGNRLRDAIGGRSLGDFAHQLVEIRNREGSGRAAARAVGVGDGTWRRWWAAAGLGGGGAGGKPAKPSAANAAKLAAAVVDGRVREAAARVEGMTMQAVMRTRSHQDNGRVRNLNASNLRLAPGAGERVAKAYYSGGAEAAAVAYVQNVTETAFYRPWLAAGLLNDWNRDGYDPEFDWYDWLYDAADMDDSESYGLAVR